MVENDQALQMNDEAIKRVKDLMKQRFGLELPDFKKPGDDVDEGQILEPAWNEEQSHSSELRNMSSVRHHHQDNRKHPPPSSVAKHAVGGGGAMIPDAMLQSLPPKIRDIAGRRPELFHEMWLAQQKADTTSHQGPVLSGIQEEAQDEDDSSDDYDEATSLLRKRGHVSAR